MKHGRLPDVVFGHPPMGVGAKKLIETKDDRQLDIINDEISTSFKETRGVKPVNKRSGKSMTPINENQIKLWIPLHQRQSSLGPSNVKMKLRSGPSIFLTCLKNALNLL
ncbi:MAG: hypothetical protein IPJ71_01200 [Bdellovibrionales bacterium]|nr:hypothetical protein [Bdellovibrionales bacterium]